MNLLDLLGSVKAVLSHRVRAGLTLLGIVIGTGSIVLLASLIHSAEQALIRTAQQAVDADLVQVDADDAPEKQRYKTQRPLSRADADELASASVLGGAKTGGEVWHRTEAHYRDKKRAVSITGGRPESRLLFKLAVAQGRFLVDSDLEQRRSVAVIGWEVHHDLGEPSLGAPDNPLVIEADGQIWTVVGVLEKKPILGATTSTNIWDRKVLVPDSTYDAVFSPTHQVRAIHVRKHHSTLPMPALRSTVEAILTRRHLGVLNFKLQKASNEGQEKLILDVIKLLLLATGLLALFVGGINIMNVMLVTVTERTREIGIRRAVGATPRLIVIQFLLESTMLSLIGGALGVFSGIGVAWLSSKALTAVVGQWDFHVELWSIGAGLSLSMVTGLIFGLLPARRAAAIKPIDALRFE